MRKLILEPKKCVLCGTEMRREQYKRVYDFKEARYCSRNCYQGNLKRENHPNWRGGVKHRPDGYLRDSATDKYIHRIVMEEYLGRELQTHEQVHHRNGNTSDNRLENLALTINGEHRKLYHHDAPRDKKGRYKKA